IFTSELHVGDLITASGQTVAIIGIASATSLSTSPNLVPAIGAGTAFTYTNPIVRWLDANGTTVAVLDARGFVAFGFPYTPGPFSVQGPTETAVNANGQQIYIQAGQGGPASSTLVAGGGGNTLLLAGEGGNSSVAGKLPGPGAL